MRATAGWLRPGMRSRRSAGGATSRSCSKTFYRTEPAQRRAPSASAFRPKPRSACSVFRGHGRGVRHRGRSNRYRDDRAFEPTNCDRGHFLGTLASQPRTPAPREIAAHQHAVSAPHRSAKSPRLTQEQKLSEPVPGGWLSGGDLAGNPVLVERVPDGTCVHRPTDADAIAGEPRSVEVLARPDQLPPLR